MVLRNNNVKFSVICYVSITYEKKYDSYLDISCIKIFNVDVESKQVMKMSPMSPTHHSIKFVLLLFHE